LAAAAVWSCTRRDAPPALNLLAWSEYVPQPLIERFTRDTGIAVNYDTFASNEEMLAKLVSGAQRYDLIQPSEYVVEALVKEHRLAPIDWAQVPNFANIGPQFTHLPHDPEQRYTVPWMAGSVGIVVNTDRVKDDVRRYDDVFQEKFRGRIVVVNDPREIVSWALASAGKGSNEVTLATLEEITPILRRWLPLVKVYDSDSPKTALLNGDVDLGVVWSGEAAVLYNEDPKFRYILPAEGAHQFIDNLAIPVDAPNPGAALAFMNYILRPEVSVLISADFPYTNPNLAARTLLSPAALHNPASYPPASPKLETFRDIGSAAVQIDKLVTDLKAQS
jgi:spermidine/putrescine transport system substrate-binding protein